MALFAPVLQQYFDNNGDPLAGGLLYTYEAGTSAPKATYTSEDESTANANPVVLDAGGRASVWLESGSYKLVLHDSADVLVAQEDDITGSAANVFGSSVVDVAANLNITSVYRNNVLRCTATPITLTLLPVATAGEGFLFSVKNISGGDITIDPDAAELIDGAATLVLQDGQSALIVCDGTGWVSLFIAPDIVDEDNTFTGNNTFTGDNDFQGDDTFSGDVTFTGAVSFADDGELTISSGSITPTGVYHRVDTEADAATDDLDTITAGTSGQKLILRAESDVRDVIIKHNTGNIVTSDEQDITLGTDKKNVSFAYDTNLSLWVVTSQPKSQATTLVTDTAQATTSGTAFLFSNIPSGTQAIHVNFLGNSLSGTDNIIVQMGDSGGLETSGYASHGTNSGGGSSTSSAGFLVYMANASRTIEGYVLTINLVDVASNSWVACGCGSSDANTLSSGGSKSLSGELDRINITRTGANTFDAGSVNISYEF
tara:strand:- start:7714 stop:9171 length:1458 start_codon:yes stop_codon:yes gene_type:complete